MFPLLNSVATNIVFDDYCFSFSRSPKGNNIRPHYTNAGIKFNVSINRCYFRDPVDWFCALCNHLARTWVDIVEFPGKFLINRRLFEQLVNSCDDDVCSLLYVLPGGVATHRETEGSDRVGNGAANGTKHLHWMGGANKHRWWKCRPMNGKQLQQMCTATVNQRRSEYLATHHR